MTSQVDLHLHSTASDGVHAPSELVAICSQAGLRYIALADHDTTDGIEEALDAAAGTPLTVIPAVEMSTLDGGSHELHILGYHIDHRHLPLQERLAQLRRSRVERAQAILDLLAKQGRPLSWDRVAALADEGSLGRPHIAQAMVEAEYADSVESAFREYLRRGGAAYVPRAKLSPSEAIDLVLRAGGVPVLAHPTRIIEHVPGLVRAGLLGLEAYYSGYLEAEVAYLRRLAKKHGLVVTGGTDYHGGEITPAPAPGTVEVPVEVVDALRARAEEVRARGDPSH
jgi:predicted metal-dependent phosphoesterase TrpH